MVIFMIGVGLFLVSFPTLWYNETNYNKSAGLYNIVKKECNTVEDSNSPQPE